VHAGPAADGVSNVVKKKSHARYCRLKLIESPWCNDAGGEKGEQSVSETNPIRVFVTHAFDESDDYLRIFEFLECVDRFYYLNVSRPEEAPQSGGMDEIKDVLIQQIKGCEAVFLVPALYEAQPDLVNFMMDAADANQKPMIVIRPFGQVSETPKALVDRANEHIEWNAREMVDALKRQARLEDTARWEVIDFPGFDSDGEIDE